MDQEQYLETSSIGRIIVRGIKKLVTEMTSVKFMLLVFVCLGIWQKFVTETIGLGVALIVLGIREAPIEAIVNKITGGIK